jgi:hypothetical protein
MVKSREKKGLDQLNQQAQANKKKSEKDNYEVP